METKTRFIAIFAFFILALVHSAKAEIKCDHRLIGSVRGFKLAMQLKLGDKIIVVDQIDSFSESVHTAHIEAITRDYKFIVSIEGRSRIINWNQIALPYDYENVKVGQPIKLKASRYQEDSYVYLGIMIDENRAVIGETTKAGVIKNVRLVSLAAFTLLDGTSPRPVLEIQNVFPQKVFYVLTPQNTGRARPHLVPAILRSIENELAHIEINGLAEKVSLSLIAQPTKSFTPDQKVALIIRDEEANKEEVEFGFVVGQFLNGDFVFTDEARKEFRIVKPSQLSKLRQPGLVSSGVFRP